MNQIVPLTRVPRRVKLRVADYLALDAAGAFADYGKTELLDGEIVYMNAQHRPHAYAKAAMYDALRDALRKLRSPLSVMIEASIALGVHNGPEPDLTLTDEPRGPGLIPAATVALVVEIADATLRSDLRRKASIYARHGVPEYWVVDVKGAVIHQMWLPTDGAYVERRVVAFDDPLTAATIPGLAIETGSLR